jgi:hypothetical protein
MHEAAAGKAAEDKAMWQSDTDDQFFSYEIAITTKYLAT